MSPLTLLYTQLRIYGLTRDLSSRKTAANLPPPQVLLPPPEPKIYNSITRKEKLICDLSECGWVIFTIITCPNSKKNLVYILDFLDFFRISCSPLINHSSCNVLLLRLHKSLKYFLLFWMEIFNILNIFSTLKYLILMKVFVYKKTPLRNFHR